MRSQAASFARLIENHDANGNAGRRKKLRGQTDHRIEHVVADELFANFAFRAGPEQHAMRRDDSHAARGRPGDRKHMEDESVVAAALRRHMGREALVRVGFGLFVPPLVKAERRIGDDDVEAHQVVALNQGRRIQRVAPVDPGAVLLVQQHVEARQRARLAVRFLTEQLEIAVADFFAGPQQQ